MHWTNKRLGWIGVAAALLATGCANDTVSLKEMPAETNAAEVTNQDGVQKIRITVDKGVYSPASVKVETGKPVEITFVKGKEVGCGGTVVFQDLEITKVLTTDETLVTFTPKKPGKLIFTCSMGMYKGDIQVN